ncbi:hypothetical protein ACI2UC_23325 [Ralstonia nicotianae]
MNSIRADFRHFSTNLKSHYSCNIRIRPKFSMRFKNHIIILNQEYLQLIQPINTLPVSARPYLIRDCGADASERRCRIPWRMEMGSGWKAAATPVTQRGWTSRAGALRAGGLRPGLRP